LSNLFDISISALQAFQTAISVTSNNIANANTPGYADESVNLTTAIPQSDGGVSLGSGVDVASVTRAIDQLNNNQLNSSQSSLGQLNSLQTYTNQVDNIIGTTAGGLTTALQTYYSAWSTVANDPTSTASRQALISAAQGLASSFQSTNSQLQGLNTGINSGITSDVSQINALANSIATLNQQITVGTADAGGQAPNDLLDQRDAALSSLSNLVGVTTSTNSNGSLNVFIGNGQPLVLQTAVTTLTTVPNQFNASQLEVSTTTNGSNNISSQITSGDLGGLLAARSQAVNPAINQIGQIATALSTSANTQQNSGLDLNGNLGADMFSIGAPQAIAATGNSDTTTATVALGTNAASVGALGTDNYLLSYANGAYSLTDASTGNPVSFTQSGNTLTAAGMTITLSKTPAVGDQFLIEPTASAAGTFTASLTNPAQIAAAAGLQVSAAAGNTGNATLGSFLNPNAQPLPAATTINFTSATQYQINGTGTVLTVGAGGVVSFDGWQATLSGTPAAGDSFNLQSNVGATGDNTNALASANQQNQGVLLNGTTSIIGATSALVTAVGSQAQQVNTAQTAQSAVNTQALAAVQSVSGVNLDQEAANLLQWQQAYQASAQALSIGNSTFSTFMDSIDGTYS
jgi:flagellar hook-associated protein 1 FlgK